MTTPFKEWKEGPVKRVTERELRELANDIEGYWKKHGSSELEDLMHVYMILAMSKRGLKPKGK